MAALELLGLGVVVAWLSLPIMARVARPGVERDPAAAYRRILAGLALSVGCLSLPWLGLRLPDFADNLRPIALSVQVLATPVGPRELGAARGYAVSPFDLVSLAWSVACATAGVRWAVARLRLSRLLARTLPAPAALERALIPLARAAGIRAPRLLLSHEAASPFSLGTWAPRIVLPASLAEELAPERLDLILRHELAHLRRRDPLTHALARLCSSVFACHPSVPGLMRELVFAREAAVDAEVAVNDRHVYASLLLEVASRARFGRDPAHVSMDDTAMARRIALLVERAPDERRPSVLALLSAAALLGGFGLFTPRVFAQPSHFHTSAVAMGDPMAPHEAEIDRCYELARAENSELVVGTRARFEVDPASFRVTSADVPTPESRTFQRCVEEKAMAWSFPPPPGMPRPPKHMPRGAKAMVAVEIEREP